MIALAFIIAVLAIPIAPAFILSIHRDGAPWRRRYWDS
jgi:hypothetical protein